jgi:hypothetical protein
MEDKIKMLTSAVLMQANNNQMDNQEDVEIRISQISGNMDKE